MGRMISTGLVLALLSGCSLVFDPSDHMAGVTSDAGIDARVPMQLYCDRFTTIACGAVRTCCDRIPPGWDETTCVNHYHGRCADLIAQVDSVSYLSWDPVAAETSLAQAETLATDCDLAFQDWQLDRDGFFGPFVGGRRRGEACTPNALNARDVAVSLLSCAGDARCIPGDGVGAGWACGAASGLTGRCTFAFDCVSTSTPAAA